MDDWRVPMPEQRAFTLIELLVVLAILGLIVSLTPIAYQRLREAAAYRDTVRTIAADLAAARQAAAASGRDVAFAVNLGDRSFGVEGRSARTLPAELDLRVTVADTQARDGIARIRFYPGGSSTGGSIDVLRPSGVGVRLRADWLDGRVELSKLP